MDTLSSSVSNFDLTVLAHQLRSVVEYKNPLSFMESKINWEIDTDLIPELQKGHGFLADPAEGDKANTETSRWQTFVEWLAKSREVEIVREAICTIVDKIKELIDARAELEKLLTVSITSLSAVLLGGPITGILLTILVGLLGQIILKGILKVCPAPISA